MMHDNNNNGNSLITYTELATWLNQSKGCSNCVPQAPKNPAAHPSTYIVRILYKPGPPQLSIAEWLFRHGHSEDR